MGLFIFIIGNTKQKKDGVATEIRRHSSTAPAHLRWGPKTIWDSVCERKVPFVSERFIKGGI